MSDFCVTPAYWGLIPTYLALWIAGRFYAGIAQHTWRSFGIFSVLSFAALSLDFLISNGVFYLFSGRYPDLSFTEYAARVTQYYGQYMTSGLVYLIPAVLIYTVAQQRLKSHAR